MRDTVLHYAAYKGNENIIRYLLSKGASPNAKNMVKMKQLKIHSFLNVIL